MSRHRVIWPFVAQLGESPVWCEAEQRLFFVDIKRPAIHVWAPDGGCRSYAMPSEIGCIVLRQSGGIVAALRSGLVFVTLEPELTFKPFATIDTDLPGNRPNDGKCDSAGRFWVATMDNSERDASGRLWRVTPDHRVSPMAHGHIVGNGVGWSPDDTSMYFTDSAARKIFSYPFDAATGTLGERRCFASIPADAGYPDGLTVDAEGYVWSAHWDGWRITRYRPDGHVDRVVPMPVPRPTSLTFGGANHDRLYVTSASIGLDAQALAEAPLSGAVFELNVGVAGRPGARFAG
jgi:sugar lactone lactonase YvrE